MKFFSLVLSCLAVFFFGFWVFQSPPLPSGSLEGKEPPFVLIVYARNVESWCEETLRSIFEQDYERYRVIWIDDASFDESYEKAEAFVLKHQQEEKVVLIQNDAPEGLFLSLYRGFDQLQEGEIALFWEGKDWLAHPGVLSHLARGYLDPKTLSVSGASLDYPSYERGGEELFSCKRSLCQMIPLASFFDLNQEPSLAVLISTLSSLAGSKKMALKSPLLFANKAVSRKEGGSSPLLPIRSSSSFSGVDFILFSFDRPMQLYACLESIETFVSGCRQIHVLYRFSEERYEKSYQEVKRRFPFVHFVAQSDKPKKDFKPLLCQIAFSSPASHLVFGVDDCIVKDKVDLLFCAQMLEKTHAYGVYLRLGENITHCYQVDEPQKVPPRFALSEDLFAWAFQQGTHDWNFPNTLDMTLFRKKDLEEPLKKLKYRGPNELEFAWASQRAPQGGIGLFFPISKVVNIPLNVLKETGNPHMNFMSPKELLTLFEEGKKIDLTPLEGIYNASPHCPVTVYFAER